MIRLSRFSYRLVAIFIMLLGFFAFANTNETVSDSSVQRVLLLQTIIIDDTIEIEPLVFEENVLRLVEISNSLRPRSMVFLIDSIAIQKYSLCSYQFVIQGEAVSDKHWINYPIKEYTKFKGSLNSIEILAKNKNGDVYSEKIEIVFPLGVFNSRLAFLIYFILLIALIVLLFFVNAYKVSREKFLLEKLINSRTKELTIQKAKYEEILTNYLPKEEFEKLKEKDRATRFKMVTVLFSNILGFTKIAEQDDAEELIDDLDRFFFHFDDVVKKLHIEKIKAIGDSYMCAGGIPQKNRTNPIEVVLAAFEMQQYMNMLKNQYNAENKKIWDLRMGIHTGPVFSNASNKKRLEVWGDTVNIASRMEASGEIGKVNITGMTYELVKDYFMCQYRGKMPVKYKGEIDMYFIEGFRPALSVDGFGLKPNRVFVTRLGLIRFDDLEEHVMNILEDELPRNLYYHNLKHTIDVTVQVELIGRQEGITDEELLLLKTAALFHDTGFIRTYKDHEEAGVLLAKSILPEYDYTEEQIEKISELIMVTKLPPNPKNLLEQIMCDSDLDYLGRVDFIPVSGNLFRELTEYNIIEDDINNWNQLQIMFISNHQYFTETAKKLRDVNKNNQLEAIRRLVEEKD